MQAPPEQESTNSSSEITIDSKHLEKMLRTECSYLSVEAECARERLSVVCCDCNILARLDFIHVSRKLDGVALMAC